MESSWVFYSKRPVLELTVKQQTVPQHERSRDWQPKPKADLRAFFAAHDQPYLITTREHIDEVQRQVGMDLEVVSEVEYFLRDKTLVLLRPAGQASQTAQRSGNLTR